MSLTTDMIHELFYYNDGKLLNKVQRGSRALKDAEVGSADSNGYLQVNINKRKYQVHRIIYILHHGHIPNKLEIDHIDGNRLNNNIDNLRAVTRQGNNHNRRKAKGYYMHPCGKWKAQIKINGKPLHLGLFTTKEEARDAYLKAKKELHPTTPNDYFGE